MEILIGIVSFLGGGFLTAVGFIISNSNKIAVMSADIAALKKAIDQLNNKPTVICTSHTEMAERIAKVEAQFSAKIHSGTG
ncbi:MAG: hypothetical protein JW967_01560 [Dehalococcoidales bacterium]|nr:hypothetical protein [Dehalococcoidales bacterium]